ncbi:MAG TPA: PaaI family thioesterase [Burkholderiaceae bacterium]|nr:PaaI family thioesterase [Burkholderiaceae bacterium]
MTESAENPDVVLVRRAVHDGLRDVPMDVNPLAADLGTRIVEAVPGRIRLSYLPGPRFIQGAGVVQGGIVATMIDFALAFAVMTRLDGGAGAATVSLTVNFVKPVAGGRLLICDARLDRLGGRMAFASAVLTDAEGELLATGSSPLAVMLK